MSLPALMPLMPTLPASAQPSEGQPPLPPVELPDEMASRDSVDGRGRAMFIPRGEDSAQTSDSVRRGPTESAGPRSRTIPVSKTTQAADAGPEIAVRKPGVVLSPAGINPRLLAMAFTQPIIQRLLGQWSEGRTVSLSIPSSPGLPEPLSAALAQAASPALMKAILAVGMRQDGVVLAAQPVASQPVVSGSPTEVSFTHHQTVAVTEHQTGGAAELQSGAVAVVATLAEIPAASVTASAAASPTLATEARGDSGNPPVLVSLTLLPLPVQPEQLRAEREPNRNRGGQRDGDSESGLSGRSNVRRVGRMLRGQVDLGHRGQLNFEIRSLNGRFSVALGATPGLGAAARPVLPVLEAALHRLPGFTELHWNG
jgi:hypothetical protein